MKLAQVVGVPDARYVEVPAAFVELDAGRELTEEELIDFCKGQIASFKVPRHVRFVTEWPMSGDEDPEVPAARPADRGARVVRAARFTDAGER